MGTALQQQEDVLAELAKITTLRVHSLPDGIRVEPGHRDGFVVIVRRLAGDSPFPYRVECPPGPWHHDLETEDEALDLLFACLSTDTRLAIDSRGAAAVAWRLEILQSTGTWVPLAPRTRILAPFWRPKTTKILSNPCLKPPSGDVGESHGSP
jgi:hypothetical protein